MKKAIAEEKLKKNNAFSLTNGIAIYIIRLHAKG